MMTLQILAFIPLRGLRAAEKFLFAEFSNWNAHEQNFHAIFSNPVLKQSFYGFLKHVFHLYPQEDFYQLIQKASQLKKTDAEVYVYISEHLKSITPFLGSLRYALPALAKQKHEMQIQTQKLLMNTSTIENYLEVGTPGRYVNTIKNILDIQGQIFVMHDWEPSFDPIDIVERGQVLKNSQYIPMQNYAPNLSPAIPKNSLDLITVYIGFHHCPLHLREAYLTQLRDCLKPKGILIVRDHDAHNEAMFKTVALAHDVFNVGTKQTWTYNQKEERHFYSLTYLESMLKDVGFKSRGGKLYQSGDPTKNALMRFEKA